MSDAVYPFSVRSLRGQQGRQAPDTWECKSCGAPWEEGTKAREQQHRRGCVFQGFDPAVEEARRRARRRAERSYSDAQQDRERQALTEGFDDIHEPDPEEEIEILAEKWRQGQRA